MTLSISLNCSFSYIYSGNIKRNACIFPSYSGSILTRLKVWNTDQKLNMIWELVKNVESRAKVQEGR